MVIKGRTLSFYSQYKGRCRQVAVTCKSDWLSDKNEKDYLEYLQFLEYLQNLEIIEIKNKMNVEVNTRESFSDFCLIENNLETGVLLDSFAQFGTEPCANSGEVILSCVNHDEYMRFCDFDNMWSFVHPTGNSC